MSVSTTASPGWRTGTRPTPESCSAGIGLREDGRSITAVVGPLRPAPRSSHELALHNNLADLLHASGHADDAMAHLKTAVEIFAEVGAEEEPYPGIWKLDRC